VVARALLEANREASTRCVFSEGAAPDLAMAGLVPGKEPGVLVSRGRAPSVTFSLPVSANPLCLRISYDRGPGERGLLFLPPPKGYPDGGIIPLGSFPKGPVIQLVLPPGLSGQKVRLRPVTQVGARISNLVISTGEIR
jgi:hypothetical protein